MIKTFGDGTTQDIFDGALSKKARKVPQELHRKARRLLDLINGAKVLHDLAVPPGNGLEALKHDLKGFHSIKVNDQYRIIFRWLDGNVEEVEILDYHP